MNKFIMNQLLSIVVVGCVLQLLFGTCMCDPQGCTYDSTLKEYSCSFRSWSLPLAYSQFSNPVQVLKVVDVDGELPSTGTKTFTGFSSISTASFDPSIDARLEVHCYAAGQIIFTAGTFADMGWVKDFRMLNCRILTMPDNVFQELGELNYFSIDGGSIENSVGFNALNGVDVKRLDTSVTPKGIFAMRNARLVASGLQTGFLFPLANVTKVILDNVNIRITSKDMFSPLTKMTSLSMANNYFTELSDGIFDKPTSLQELNFTGIQWVCSCTNLWIQQFIVNNNISSDGGIVCTDSTRGKDHYETNCVEKKSCGTSVGISLNDTDCLKVADMVLYSLTLVAIVIAVVAFSMIIHSRRQMPRKKGKVLVAKKDRKMSGSNFKKLTVDERPNGNNTSKKMSIGPKQDKRNTRHI